MILTKPKPKRGAPAPAPRPEGWLRSAQVAKALGYSDRTIRRWCEAGKVPGAILGESGAWRIPKEWLEELLSGRRANVIRRRRG